MFNRRGVYNSHLIVILIEMHKFSSRIFLMKGISEIWASHRVYISGWHVGFFISLSWNAIALGIVWSFRGISSFPSSCATIDCIISSLQNSSKFLFHLFCFMATSWMYSRKAAGSLSLTWTSPAEPSYFVISPVIMLSPNYNPTPTSKTDQSLFGQVIINKNFIL